MYSKEKDGNTTDRMKSDIVMLFPGFYFFANEFLGIIETALDGI